MRTIIFLVIMIITQLSYGQSEKSYLFLRVVPKGLSYQHTDSLNFSHGFVPFVSSTVYFSADSLNFLDCFIFQVDTLSHKEMKKVKKVYKSGKKKENTYAAIITKNVNYNILDSLFIKSIAIGDSCEGKIKLIDYRSPFDKYIISMGNCLNKEARNAFTKDFNFYINNRTIWFSGIVVLDKRSNVEKTLSFGIAVR